MKKILSAITALVLTLALLTGAACAQDYTYDDIFLSRNIFRMDSVFFMLDYYGYAIAMPDGVIDCNEYGVSGNVINRWVETIYLPTHELNAEEKAALEYDMTMNFAAMDAEEFCVVTTLQLNNYLVVTLSFTDLEKEENVDRLAELGFIGSGVDYLGIAITEESLLAQGYLKNE